MDTSLKKPELNKKAILLSMLKYIDHLFSKEDIWYSLAYGTLLGAVREKGFIPWDEDADIFVRYRDIERIRKIIREDKDSSFHLCVPGEEKNYSSCNDRLILSGISHEDCHLDIFALIGLPEKNPRKYVLRGYITYAFFTSKHKALARTRRKLAVALLKPFSFLFPDKYSANRYKRLATRYPYERSKYLSVLGAESGHYYAKNDMEETLYLDFENTRLACIKEYDTFLKTIYGDYNVPRKSNYVIRNKSDMKNLLSSTKF